MDNENRAIFVYEEARFHAVLLGCPVIPDAWDDREQDFKDQFRELIADLRSGKKQFRNYEEAHDSWVEKYFEMGWEYGVAYDEEKRIHPDLVPYNELDPKEKIKIEIFVRLVKIACACIWLEGRE